MRMNEWIHEQKDVWERKEKIFPRTTFTVLNYCWQVAVNQSVLNGNVIKEKFYNILVSHFLRLLSMKIPSPLLFPTEERGPATSTLGWHTIAISKISCRRWMLANSGSHLHLQANDVDDRIRPSSRIESHKSYFLGNKFYGTENNIISALLFLFCDDGFGCQNVCVSCVIHCGNFYVSRKLTTFFSLLLLFFPFLFACSPAEPSKSEGQKTKPMNWKLCIPGTDCDFGDMASEADAKEFLRPGADTNPGRRRRRSTDTDNSSNAIRTESEGGVRSGDIDCNFGSRACRNFLRKLASIVLRRAWCSSSSHDVLLTHRWMPDNNS